VDIGTVIVFAASVGLFIWLVVNIERHLRLFYYQQECKAQQYNEWQTKLDYLSWCYQVNETPSEVGYLAYKLERSTVKWNGHGNVEEGEQQL